MMTMMRRQIACLARGRAAAVLAVMICVGAIPTVEAAAWPWPAVSAAQHAALQDEDPQPNDGDGEAAPEAEPDEDDQEKVEAKVEEDEYFALFGGVVHTVSGPDLRDATILCRNGKIVAVGPHVSVPDDATRIDAGEFHVYPGLIAVSSSGILGGGDPSDSTDVYSLTINLALASGITTALTGDTVAKLTFGTLDDMTLKRGAFESLSYSSNNPDQKRKLRESLERVRQYRRDLTAHEEKKKRNPDAKPPDDSWMDGEAKKHLRLINGEAVAKVSANRTHELLEICELAQTYGIETVIDGAFEGWTVAPEMAQAGVSAIVTPRTSVDPDRRFNRPNGSSIQNASILNQHGVCVAVMPVGSWFGSGEGISLGGLAGRDLAHLSMEAAFAVRGGMSNDDAVRTITINAARILGVDDRVGSIEVGKDADFIVTTGDLLHYTTGVRWTIVNGNVVYDKQEDTLYSHIRPDESNGADDSNSTEATAPQDGEEQTAEWPRRLGDEL